MGRVFGAIVGGMCAYFKYHLIGVHRIYNRTWMISEVSVLYVRMYADLLTVPVLAPPRVRHVLCAYF